MWIAVPFDGVDDEAEADRELRRAPDGESVAAAGAQHATRFGNRRVGTREVQHPVVHHDRIELLGVERQRFRVALAKRDRGMTAARLLDHRSGKIEAGDDCASLRRDPGHEPRSGRDVEHTQAGVRAHGIEQRTSRLAGQIAERFRIVFRGALPPRPLEVVERRRIEWLSHGPRATIPV